MKFRPNLVAVLFLASATGVTAGVIRNYADEQAAIALEERNNALTLAAAPPYEPHRWNTEQVQKNNNCYAYAADDIDTVEYGAMPGKRTLNQDPPYLGDTYWEWQKRLIRGAIADGMIYTGDKPAAKPGYYRVVLLMHPDHRYGLPYHHWLRQGPDGYWSGKDGPTPATDRDRDGRRIANPEQANLGFPGMRGRPVGYFLVPHGGLDVGNPNEPKTHAATRAAWQAPPPSPPQMESETIVVTAKRHKPPAPSGA